MANQISLTAGTRQNLLLLQQTATSLQNTQLKLATGNKINSALDGPTSFFAAQSLNQRASDLDSLKDGMGQAISTLKAGDSGITTIQSYIQQAQGLATQALGNLGNDANSVALRNSLADQYNGILRQIDKLAQDSGYQGKNLLVGSGLSLDATASSKQAVNALQGISGATATNVTSADTYTIAVTGDGAISGSTSDIQGAESERGISNLTLSGFDSATNGNFDAVSIKLSGGVGKDKTFTVTEGGKSQTLTFTQDQWNAANAQGKVLHASVSFTSGTKVNFDVDFNKIEDTPDTAGVGTSTIEKLVNLQVKATNSAGETVVRDGLNPLGQGKASDGENAFAFDSGTARVSVDQRQILQGSAYSQSVGGTYGTAAAAITGTPTVTSGSVATDTTYKLTAAGSGFDYTTNTFSQYSVTLTNAAGSVVGTIGTVSAGNASNLVFSGGAAGVEIKLSLNVNELTNLATAASAGDTEIAKTNSFQATGGFAAATTISAQGGAGASIGFAADTVTTVNYTISATGSSSAIVKFDDGMGGTATQTVAISNGTIGAISATLSGGVNNNAHVQITAVSVTNINSGDSVAGSFKVRGQGTGLNTASFDIRAAHTAATAQLQTKQLVDGNDSNNLTVQLNESNTSTVTVVSQNVQTDGQGLKLDEAQNGWNDRADIQNAVDQLTAATSIIRGASSNLSTNLNIIQSRQDYTANFSNVLQEGAGKLTLADQNEEGANILTLQTRQQLGTISLSLANQAQQAILRLF
ncbi:MAG TPA: hypothetical protein VM659_16780 [Dongiaceae bacterium]|nr:hypothetical protein [Dongiaceae bacterium]